MGKFAELPQGENWWCPFTHSRNEKRFQQFEREAWVAREAMARGAEMVDVDMFHWGDQQACDDLLALAGFGPGGRRRRAALD